MNMTQYRTYIMLGQDGGEILDEELTANGTVETKILMQKKGEICMRPGAVSGTYTQRYGSSTNEGSLTEFFTTDPTQPERHWKYTCDARQLHFVFDVADGLTFEWYMNKKP
jgi:hypothetical protein